MQPDELKKAYVGCDVYIFPTYEETEGIVLLEALAARANVIVRDIGCFDWLKNGADCYKASDTSAFETDIIDIVEGKRPSLRDAGHDAVEDKSIDKVGERLKQVYEDAMKV